MADNKKYYYLKLKENFFDTDELLLLESMTDGILYSNILLKLYLRSLKNNGKLMFKDMIPYTPETLAIIVRQPVAVIEKSLLMFQQLGLIDVLDSGAIYMMDIQNFIGKSSTEGDRKRLYRNQIEKEKDSLGHLSNIRPPEIEQDIKIDIKKDINIELEKEPSLVAPSADLSKCVQCYESNIGTLSKAVSDRLLFELQQGTNADLICAAIEETVLKNIRSWNYIQAILDRCKQEGIKSKVDFEQRKKPKGDATTHDTPANLDAIQPTGTVVL